MGVQERLSLSATNANTLIAAEHVHRYRLAARLCAGMRVIDLACGSGYGSAILRETASAVLGIDNDAATIDMAQATVGSEHDVRFESADALDFLCGDLGGNWDAIVCFEGLEHLQDPQAAVEQLTRHANAGVKLLISLPNSRTFEERNEFHVTEFGYEEANATLRALGEMTLLYQHNAEGSLIRGAEEGELQGEFVLGEYGEPEYANHFIALVNLGDRLQQAPDSARMHLAVAPDYNRHMLSLEKANRELWRENARIGRHHLGRSDAAAATALFRLQEEVRVREERIAELEAERAHLMELLDTPRHRLAESAHQKAIASPGVYSLARRLWSVVRPR
jgi:SAM-dependent methyltransferase